MVFECTTTVAPRLVLIRDLRSGLPGWLGGSAMRGGNAVDGGRGKGAVWEGRRIIETRTDLNPAGRGAWEGIGCGGAAAGPDGWGVGGWGLGLYFGDWRRRRMGTGRFGVVRG